MKKNGAIFGLTLAALLLCGRAGAAEAAKPDPKADELQALQAEVKRLAQELEAMKAKTAKAEAVPVAAQVADTSALAERLDVVEIQQKDAVVMGDVPGSFRVPGTELSIRLYGFAELNYVHAFGPDNSDIDYATFPPYLPLNDTPEGERKNRDYLTARTSRFGVEAATPTRYGVLGMKLEGDFNNEPRTGNTAQYGTSANLFTQQQTSSYGFRIRHAYGTFGGLLVGQTWSTFMDLDNYPETVDFNGPTGATFIRQPLVRYSYGTPSAGTFTVALENGSSYVLDSRAELAPGEDNPDYFAPIPTSLTHVPDVVVRWDKGFQWGALSARAMTQQLRFDDGAGTDAATRGWGAAASASFKVRGADWLAMQVTGGDGVGRYLNYIEGAIYDGVADEIRTERAIGVIAGYQHKPADWVRVNLVYGATRNFDSDYTDVAKATGLDSGRFGVNRYVQQLHLGPIFTPVKGVDLGVEGIWATRKTLAGEKGEDLRLNVSAKYYIN
jgi:outer membrane murein-binding lipoprotein Lpp